MNSLNQFAVTETAALGWIWHAERSWVVGFYHIAGATEALSVVSHTHPPVKDWMVRVPRDEDLKWGGCCPRSTAMTMEGKSGATVGSHKFYFPLKTKTIFHCTIASCMPWCSLPWKRNEFPRQARRAPHLSLTTMSLRSSLEAKKFEYPTRFWVPFLG